MVQPVRSIWIVAIGLFCTSCGGDPILERAAAEAGKGSAGSSTQGSGSEGATKAVPATTATPGKPGQPTPGKAGEPTPVQEGAPPPGDPSQPAPGVPDQPPPGDPAAGAAAEGPTVKLAGQITVADYQGGPIRIDIFDGDQRDLSGPRPAVVAVARLEAPGPFEVPVPQSASKVWLGAYVDANNDGRPGPGEAAGWFSGNPVDTSKPRGGLSFELKPEAPPPPGG